MTTRYSESRHARISVGRSSRSKSNNPDLNAVVCLCLHSNTPDQSALQTPEKPNDKKPVRNSVRRKQPKQIKWYLLNTDLELTESLVPKCRLDPEKHHHQYQQCHVQLLQLAPNTTQHCSHRRAHSLVSRAAGHMNRSWCSQYWTHLTRKREQAGDIDQSNHRAWIRLKETPPYSARSLWSLTSTAVMGYNINTFMFPKCFDIYKDKNIR